MILDCNLWIVWVVKVVELSKLEWSCFHFYTEMLKDVLNESLIPFLFLLLLFNQLASIKEELNSRNFE